MAESRAAEERNGFKLLAPHVEGCWYESGEGDPFVCHDGTEWNRTIDGRRGGSWSWERFCCNNPSCPAIAIIRVDKLAAFVSAGVQEAFRVAG